MPHRLNADCTILYRIFIAVISIGLKIRCNKKPSQKQQRFFHNSLKNMAG